MKIISVILLLLSTALSIKHGMDAFRGYNPDQTKIMADMGISPAVTPYIGVISILIAIFDSHLVKISIQNIIRDKEVQ